MLSRKPALILAVLIASMLISVSAAFFVYAEYDLLAGRIQTLEHPVNRITPFTATITDVPTLTPVVAIVTQAVLVELGPSPFPSPFPSLAPLPASTLQPQTHQARPAIADTATLAPRSKPAAVFIEASVPTATNTTLPQQPTPTARPGYEYTSTVGPTLLVPTVGIWPTGQLPPYSGPQYTPAAPTEVPPPLPTTAPTAIPYP